MSSSQSNKKGKKPNWLKFDPKVGVHDKRNREDAVGDLEMTVYRNLNKYGIPSCAMAASVNIHREVREVKILVPDGSPLDQLFKLPDIKKSIEEAFILQQQWIFDKIKEKVDNEDEIDQDYSIQSGVESVPQPAKPNVPIFSLSESQMRSYYPNLLRSLYEIEKITKYRLWPKKMENGETVEATKLEMYDQNAEEIIPRNLYGGSCKSGPRNLLWRQKCISAYFLMKLNKNINTYCKEVPNDYIGKNYTIDSILYIAKNKPEFPETSKFKSPFESKFSSILKKHKNKMDHLNSEKQKHNKVKHTNTNSAELYYDETLSEYYQEPSNDVVQPNNDVGMEKVSKNILETENILLKYTNDGIMENENTVAKKMRFDENILKEQIFRSPFSNSPSERAEESFYAVENISAGEFDYIEEVPKCIQCLSKVYKNTPAITCKNCSSETHLKCVESYSKNVPFTCHRCQLKDHDLVSRNLPLDKNFIEEVDAFENQVFEEIDIEKGFIKSKNKNLAELPETFEPKYDRLDAILKELNMSNYLSLFTKEKVDVDILKKMSHSDLGMLGIETFGDRFRIIEKLKKCSSF